MSALPIELLASTTATGYEDGFGRRALAFDREDGGFLERLYFRPAFAAYERAIRDVVDRLANVGDDRIVAPISLERDPDTGELVLVSPFAAGSRLGDLIELACEQCRDETVVPGIDVAIGFLTEVLPVLELLRQRTSLAHGALAPSRIVLSPAGRLALVEAGFSGVLQKLNLQRTRLWREYRIAMPPAAGAARFDSAADIGQAALCALMLALGRPLDQDDTPETLPELMAEAIEIAQIRSSMSFAVGLQRFLQRALPLPGRRPYPAIDAALADVRHLASVMGGDMCRTALGEFARQMHGLEPAPAVAEAPVATIALDIVVDAPHVEVEEETAVDLAPVVEEPLAAAEPVAVAPQAEPAPEVASQPEPVVEPVKPSPRRKRGRGERHESDSLRSIVAPAVLPPALEPVAVTPVEEPVVPAAVFVEPQVPAPVVAAEPAIAEPVVEPVVVEPVVAQPVFTEPVVVERFIPAPSIAPPLPPQPPAPVALQPSEPIVQFSPPPIPQPVFPPIRVQEATPLTVWEPAAPAAPVAPTALAPARPAPPVVVIAPPASLRIKTEAPAGYAPRQPRHDPREFSGAYVDRRSPASSGGRRLPLKFAVAAAFVLVTVITAGRVYLPDRTMAAAATAPAAVKTVGAPVAVTTGTLIVQSQPAGARVLLDGGAAGETPLRIENVAAGRHVVTLITASATIKRNVRVDADKTVTLDVPVFSGWVAVFAPIVLEVSEEGRVLGTTEQDRLLLPPGRHTLTLSNRELGYSATHAVEVEAGEVATLNVQPRGTVNLNAQPWAEVWIDGQKTGETPIANLQLPLGTREIIFRHPQFGERRVTTTIRAGAPAAVTVDFSK